MNRQKRRRVLFEIEKDRINYKNKLFNLIFHMNSVDMEKVLGMINMRKSLRKVLDSILMPQSIQEMSRGKIVINTEMQIENIFFLYSHIIKLYADIINEYVVLKNEFEKKLFLQKYEEALIILEEIEKVTGKSIWVLSKKMLLLEKIQGLEVHKKYLARIQEDARNNVLLSTIFEIESYFAEDNTSYFAYKKRLEMYCNALKGNEIIPRYLDFRFNVERVIDSEDDFVLAMMFEGQFSLVDLYETYILSIQLLQVNGKKESVKDYILADINDFRLQNILFLENAYQQKISDDKYYRLLEMYTCGNYIEYINAFEVYFLEQPQNFQSIVLYIKSLILADVKVQFDNELFMWIYDLYSLNNNDTLAIQKLLTFIKSVRGTSWESKIIGLVARKTTMPHRKIFSYIAAINDLVISPNWINSEYFPGNKEKFIGLFDNVCPVTQELFNYKNNKAVLPSRLVDVNRRLLFEADTLIREKDLDSALMLLQSIAVNNDYFEERILRRKIVIYELQKDYLSEIRCITEAIIKNANFLKRIDIKAIAKLVKRNRTIEIKKELTYVVFTYLSDPSNLQEQRIAYANYMEENRYASIDQVIKGESNLQVLVVFLDAIYQTHLIKKDIIVNPDGKLTNEIRMDVLNKLISIDNDNKKKYNNEIAQIAKEKNIKDRKKQIDQSRIYVNTERIKIDNIDSLKEEYARYMSMKDFDSDISSFDIYSDDYINNLKKVIGEMNDKIRTSVTYSQKVLVLKGLITTIVEEFLFNNKYGLNTFLSSRIRHGYCKNQLTSLFQDYNLLSKKKENDSKQYLINEYWDEKLPNDSSGSQKIKEYLAEFTLDVENKVEEFKNTWLSIKYKEETCALLDFTPCVNSALVLDMQNISDFDTFYDIIIDYLWEYTLSLFEILRKKIQEELLAFFLQELNILVAKINQIKDDDVLKAVQMITNNITLCKSLMGGKIKEFANVFEKRDVTYLDYSMTDLIDTCLEINSELWPGLPKELIRTTINDSTIYIGELFPYFVDIVNILINNALEHSQISDYQNMDISITVSEVHDEQLQKEIESKINACHEGKYFVELSIANKIGETVDVEELEKIINQKLQKVNDVNFPKNSIQSEGGTGLYKLINTLNYSIGVSYFIKHIICNNVFKISIYFDVNGVCVNEQ